MRNNGEQKGHMTVAQVKETLSRQQLLTIGQMARILGIGRTKSYELLREGMPVVRIGRALRISSTSLETWIAEHEQQYE